MSPTKDVNDKWDICHENEACMVKGACILIGSASHGSIMNKCFSDVAGGSVCLEYNTGQKT